ncbi:hypothetical protein ACFRCW_42450 [Streptomyces sp. NPDC056653]|uniref:hypothetical protein n=1 Tax=Streptomyces sp. NPDC056653 TaxID=3345894 RepID=UPI0036968123
MPRILYPYKIRIQLTAVQGAKLQALSAREDVAITALIREFIDAGLKRSGITVTPEQVKGQTTIDGETA